MTNTINAATIYAAAIAAADTIKAAATAAGWGHYADEQTPGAIYRGMIDDAKRLASGTPYGYEMEHAQALEIEPDQKAPHWMRAHSYTHEETYKATAARMQAAALSELLEHITAPSAPEFLTIKTSERGAMRIKNCAKNLQNFAAKVKSNAKAFGGGFTRATSANKGAQTYSTQALKVWRERLQERDYAGALELADDKLSPLFFIGNKGVPFMMVAPVDVEGVPDLFSAMHENGKYNVQEKHAGRAISADYQTGTRAKSLELATAAWREASEEKRANALHRARTDAVSQAKARAAWCELRGLETTTSEETAQDQAAAMAQDQAHACEQVAAIVATAAAAAAIATAQETSAAHQAETSEARELETCSAATSEATSTSAATYGHASTTSTPASARAPVTLDNGRVVVCRRAPNGSQDAFMQDGAPMSGAEWAEFCARIAGNHQDQARAKRRTIHNPEDYGAQWTATLRTSAAGAYSLRFMGDGGAWEPVSEHATRRERAQALRALIQKNADNVAGFDDTPEDNDQAAPELATDQADHPSAAQGIDTPASADQAGQGIEGADYTTQRETSEPAADYTDTRETLNTTSAAENEQEAPDYVGTATYSPQDNKLRLTPFARLDRAIYDQLKAAGFTWAPKQGVFVAAMWTPGREDLLQRLAGDIEDEDSTTEERAADRAARFETYSEKREREASAAHDAVHAIGARFEFGQPILIGHHSERKARKDKERMDNGMRLAVKLWDTAQYWERRAAASVAHARYLERADVRERRIKTIEADKRKAQRNYDEAVKLLKFWNNPDITKESATRIAGNYSFTLPRKEGDRADFDGKQTAYGALTDSYPTLYAPRTFEEVKAHALYSYERFAARQKRWLDHYSNRIAYERAMLAAVGGTVEERFTLEPGGAVQCWASRRGGWSTIQKVNRVTVTVLDNWGNGGRDFTRNIEKDKLHNIMTRAQVDAARADGRLVDETPRGFLLADKAPETTPPAAAPAAPETMENPAQEAPETTTATPPTTQAETTRQARDFDALRATLKSGGAQVVSAPQLFPTPAPLAARMAQLARLDDGATVLEPSAGTGMLLAAIRSAAPGAKRTAVEINQTLCTILRAQDKAAQVVAGDFLEWTAPALFDAVVMNPPFKDAADIAHILHALAMLKPGGRLVAICAGGPRQADKLGALVENMGGLWEPLPAGTFAQAGTQVNAVLLCITTPHQHQAAPELATTDQADQPSAAQGIDTPASADQAGQSIEGADYTTPRETSAPAADYITPRKTLKIAEIRRVIDSCNWSRNDLGGATRSEFKAMNVPARLNPHIDAVRALQIPARFKRDIENQANAIEYAKKTIERWHAMQDQPQPPSAPDNAPPEPTTGNTMTNTNTEPERMTGAELQTLRESCNLSREDFAGLAGVQSRTVKHWESGRAGVPADVAHLVNTIDGAINAAADQARAHLEQLTRQNDQAPADIVLIRYRSNEDLHQYRPDMQAMPACVHGAIVNRMRQEARAKGIPARVVWMEPEQYNPWRAACHLPDTESTRAAWAAQQVDNQAMPHRGDQPPA